MCTSLAACQAIGRHRTLSERFPNKAGADTFIDSLPLFEGFLALAVHIAVFQIVTQCSLVGVYHRFEGTFCLHRQDRSVLGEDYVELYRLAQKSVNVMSHNVAW
jgi:hypothetical protein